MKTHIIRWVSLATGSIGTGKRLFEKEEAERLAAELNASHPDIDHEAILSGVPAGPAPTDTPSTVLSSLASGPQTERESPLPKPGSGSS